MDQEFPDTEPDPLTTDERPLPSLQDTLGAFH